MKKIILALVFLLASVGGVFASDLVTTKFADGVVGTSGVAYRVKEVIVECAPNGAVTTFTYCYGQLWNGTAVGTAANLYLQFSATVTQVSQTFDYTKINQKSADLAGTGVLFGSGVYYDEVTGAASVTIVYEPKSKF